MFAIEYFCGSKFGRWARGEGRFADRVAALNAIAEAQAAESLAGCHSLWRRVVAA